MYVYDGIIITNRVFPFYEGKGLFCEKVYETLPFCETAGGLLRFSKENWFRVADKERNLTGKIPDRQSKVSTPV